MVADDIGTILQYDDIELICKSKKRGECTRARAGRGKDKEQRRSGRPSSITKQSTAEKGEITAVAMKIRKRST
jgi:hypothetical protein